MNSAPSYRVEQCGGRRNWGIGGPSTTDTSKAGLMLPRGGKCNHTQGLNPPASPGGHYVIKCANKFSVVTGAQGLDLNTGGPVNISGGITQITGPEVTVGSSTGKLALAGDVINMEAKSIEMAPTDGHLFVRGTISSTANLIVGGHAHLEGATVVNLKTTGRNESSTVSAQANTYGGPAFWAGPGVEGVKAALRELASYATMSITDPEQFKIVPSVRWSLGLTDAVTNVAYSTLPLEKVITGICFTLLGPGIVINYPHVHAVPDGMHTHETRVPDIDCTADSAKELRAMAANVELGVPLHENKTKLVEVLQEIFGSTVGAFFISIGSALQHLRFSK